MIRVFVNPWSGSGAASALVGHWDALDPIVIDFGELANQLRRHVRPGSVIVAAGGDGTVSSLVGGLFEVGLAREVTLVIYPVGTGNDLARSLGCPSPPDPASFIAAVRGNVLEIADVAVWQIGARYALNYIGIGLDASILARADRWRRHFRTRPILRKWSLALAGLSHAAYRVRNRVVVRTDGIAIDLREASGVLLSNVGFYGGGRRVGAHNPSEATLCVTVLERNTDFLRLMLSTFIDQQVPTYTCTEWASIEGGPVAAQIDGEVAVVSAGRITYAGHVRIGCVTLPSIR